jgi:hypothetical protein
VSGQERCHSGALLLSFFSACLQHVPADKLLVFHPSKIQSQNSCIKEAEFMHKGVHALGKRMIVLTTIEDIHSRH